MPFIDLSGSRFHYTLDGPAHAPVLVLSNSLGTDKEMWQPQLLRLTSAFRVLRYDARGHGQSAVTPGPYTIEQLGRDVVALLDALTIARASFCGISMGGATGMWLATHAPARLDKLVLSNTAARFGTPEAWNARIEALRRGGLESIAAGLMERWFSAAFRARAADTVAAMQRMLLQTPPAGYIACCEAVRDVDQRDAIAAIRIPTLIIAGTHDVATPPADGKFLADRIPQARYVELEAAHLSNLEQAEKFNDAVLRFLSD